MQICHFQIGCSQAIPILKSMTIHGLATSFVLKRTFKLAPYLDLKQHSMTKIHNYLRHTSCLVFRAIWQFCAKCLISFLFYNKLTTETIPGEHHVG